MATIFKHIKPFEKRAIDHFRRCIYEAHHDVEEAQRELDFYTELLQRFEPCPDCGGQGDIAHHVSQDDTHYEKCSKCSGQGTKVLKEASP
jgi:ssDNA-binding Zn-finger/Zn-ribbon topoisomerase 1